MPYDDLDKEALKTNAYTVLAKLYVLGTDIIFTEDDCIVDWNYEDYRYVPNNGFIGQFVERILDGTLRNVPSNITLDDKEIGLEIDIVNNLNLDEHGDPIVSWYDYGNFLVTKFQREDTTGKCKFEACDYAKKFNKVFTTSYEYESGGQTQTKELTFPCTASELAQFICDEVNVNFDSSYKTGLRYIVGESGLTAGKYCFLKSGSTYYRFTTPVDLDKNSVITYNYTNNQVTLRAITHNNSTPVVTYYTLNVTSGSKSTYTPLTAYSTYQYSFTNNDFVIESNQYDSDATCRKVIQDIAKLAYSWARINYTNRLFFDFTPMATTDVDQYDELTTDEYYVSKKNDLPFGPVNKVLIGMSNVDGENMYKTSQDYTPETECAIKIWDNNLTNTDELRAIALYGAERLFGITYTPMEIDTVGHPWLEGDELIKLTNVDGEVVYTYPFNRSIKYNGVIEGKISSETGTVQENKYEYTSDIISSVRKTAIEVDKENQRINLLVENVDDNTSKISNLTLSVDGIEARVGDIETTEVVGVTNEYAVNTSPTNPPAQSSSDWSTTQPTRGEGEYIWARIKTTYKEGNPTYSDPVNTTGDKGDPGGSGTPGASIDSIIGYYAVSDSNSSTPQSGWTTDLGSLILTNDNKYLWAYYITTYTEGKSPTGGVENASVIGTYGDKGDDGNDGAPGTDGRGITSITEYYLATSASSGVTRSTSGWTTTAQTMSATNKYLWTYRKIVYTSGTTTEYVEPYIIGVFGVDGTNGKGITSVTELYYVSNSSDAPLKPSYPVTTSSLTTYNAWNLQCPPYTTTYKYFYTCSQILFSDNTYGWTNVTKNQGLAIANENAYNASEAVANIDISKGNLWFNYQKPKADASQWTTKNSGETLTIGSINEDLPLDNEYDFALWTNGITSYYVPFDKNKTYKAKAWLKSKSSQASSTSLYYPSIVPFDYDKQPIGYANIITIDNSTTTLAQQLKSGDTKVYLTSVEGFPTGTATKGYFVGIFNDVASNGYSYETYTRHIYQFANTNDNLNNIIDTTNNTVTLKSAYTGSTIPAGTKVSCTQAGSTYIYPFNGIRYNQTPDWVYKERIFDIGYDRRLKEAGFLRFYPYTANVYYYGLSLTDYTEAINSTEIIVGTQTAATNSWTGVASFGNLLDGMQIAYWLPYAGNSSGATLNLTLADGTTTGAINCYYGGTTRITNHYAAGNVIHLTYRVNANISGSLYTGWWADANYDSNNYDRVRFNQNITAGAAIAAGQLIVKVGTTFKPLAASLAFDVTQPILYAGSALANAANGSNNYLSYPGVPLRSTVSGITLTTGATCYLVGSLEGNTFTTKSSGMLTTTVPNSNDGYYYMSLGYMYSATAMILFPEHPMYKYIDGEFKSLNQASYDANIKIDTLEIGGRNLLRRTKDFTNENVPSDATGYLRNYGTISESVTYEDFGVRYRTSSSNSYLGEWLLKDCKNGETYTLSFWVKGNKAPRCYFHGPSGYIQVDKIITQNGVGASADGNSDVAGGIPFAADKWQRVWITWTLKSSGGTSTDKYVLIRNDNLGEIYIAGAKLERGDKATDWTPAPEDTEGDIDGINQSLQSYVTKETYEAGIKDAKDSIEIYAGKNLVTKTEYGTFEESVRTAIAAMPDAAVITATAQQVVNDSMAGISETISDIEETFTFDTNGLEIARSGNSMSLLLQNDRMSFMNSGNEKAYMTSNSFVLSELNQLQLGKFAFVVRSNGSLDFKKVK